MSYIGGMLLMNMSEEVCVLQLLFKTLSQFNLEFKLDLLREFSFAITISLWASLLQLLK